MKYAKRLKLVAISGGSRAPALAAQHHVDFEPQYDHLLSRSDVDAVLIATPQSGHMTQTIQAAEHGKHVLVEKPMALTISECDRMISAAKRSGVCLEVVQTLRFRGTPSRAKKMISEGAIGQVRMIRGTSLFPSAYDPNTTGWFSDPKEGGFYLDHGVHSFDIMRHFSGSDVKRVFAKATSFGRDETPFSTAMTQLEMKNGTLCQQWMSFEMPRPTVPDSAHRYVVVGERGILDVDGYGKLMLGRGDGWETVWTQPYFDPIKDPMNPARLEAFYNQIQAFVDDVLDGRAPAVPGSEGRAAVEVVQAGRLSSESGKSIDLPL